MSDSFRLHGLRIVPSPIAEQVVVTHEVVRHPTAKRRKQWRVARSEQRRPTAYVFGDTVYAHPVIVAELRCQSVREPA